ncbi:MAG TPA: hypothetical protein VFY92_09035, partial [Hyphomicrobiaceae bacterium]|nr:hypothetical protein [Hyphomicrobiaceae bacterium]
MRKGYLVGLGAVLAFGAVTVTDASACSRRVSDCGSSYDGYRYAPVPPAPVYGYGYAPRRIYRWNGYGFGPTRGYYGAAYNRGYQGYTGYGYGYGY